MYLQWTVDIQEEKKRKKQFTYSLLSPLERGRSVWNGRTIALSLAPPNHPKQQTMCQATSSDSTTCLYSLL